MSIVQSSQQNTITISDTVSSQNVTLGITLLNVARAEIIVTVRSAQAIGQTRNYYLTGRILNTTTIQIQRGGNQGVLVCTFQVIEYTAASGILVDTGSSTFSSNPLSISVPSRTLGKRYPRVMIRSTTNNPIQTQQLSFELDSDTNLEVEGDVAASNITVEWQTIFVPDATVHRISGNTSGTTHNVDLTGLGIVKEEAFVIQSMHYNGSGGIDSDEYKGANLNADTNIQIYSFANDSMAFKTAIVHRQQNKVQRTDSTFTITPFSVVIVDSVDLDESALNICSPNQYMNPTNETTNNSQTFACTALFNSSTAHTLQKFLGGSSTRIISEVIEFDANPLTGGFIYKKLERGVSRGIGRGVE